MNSFINSNTENRKKTFTIIHGRDGKLVANEVEAVNANEACGKYFLRVGNRNIRRRSVAIFDDNAKLVEPKCKNPNGTFLFYREGQMDLTTTLSKLEKEKEYCIIFYMSGQKLKCYIDANSMEEAIGLFLDYHDITFEDIDLYERRNDQVYQKIELA